MPLIKMDEASLSTLNAYHDLADWSLRLNNTSINDHSLSLHRTAQEKLACLFQLIGYTVKYIFLEHAEPTCHFH